MAQTWTRHVDADGFSVARPAGWRVLKAHDGGFSIVDPHGSAAALVLLRRLPAGTDLAGWLRRDFAASEPGLHNVRGLLARRAGSARARASFDYGSDVLPGRAEVLAVCRGDITTLYIAAAARCDFAQRLPLLQQVLDSVRWEAEVTGSEALTVPATARR